MTKHVLAFRTGHNDNWRLYLGADDFQLLINEGPKAAAFWEGRQFAVFTQHAPRPWWTEKRRCVFGLKDAELYKITYGVEQPFPDGLGRMIHEFDHLLVGG